jgi:hypothetical protein
MQSVLTAIQEKNWNVYREEYETMEMEDLIHINTSIDAMMPVQRCSDLKNYSEAFKLVVKKMYAPMKVLELGCYRGYNAHAILSANDKRVVRLWEGFDVNHAAVDSSVVADLRYFSYKQRYWLWEMVLPEYHLFTSSHTLEHLSYEQVDKTIKCLQQTPYMLIELPPMPKSWENYRGSHVFKGGMLRMDSIFTRYGYKDISRVRGSKGWVTVYEKQKNKIN